MHTCRSCGLTAPGKFFRGTSHKSEVCLTCEEDRPHLRWCRDCGWRPREEFTWTGRGQKYLNTRCAPCRTARAHGVTVSEILERQGSQKSECAACGSVDQLRVDHDHAHCPGLKGCHKCVRGYLCNACNTAEGLLRTPERAMALAVYMEKIAGRLYS